MKKYTMLLAVFLGLPLSANGFQADFSTTRFLNSYTRVTLGSSDGLILYRQDEIIIADEDGKKFASDGVRQTDFRRLRKMDATVFNPAGKRIQSLRKQDIVESTVTYAGVYSKHKSKSYTLTLHELPCRLVQSKEIELKSSFFWPHWDPQQSVDVVLAKLEVIAAKGTEFDYQLVGELSDPEVSVDERGMKHYVWVVENVTAYESEFHRAPEAMFQIGVKFMPKYFKLNDVAGSNENWRTFGRWYHELIQEQLRFTPDAKTFDWLSSVTDTRERVRRIYRYLQEKTRYVQIYLGVDGWRPHEVNSIHQAKYGDCKDLSVYMIAMLKKAGITAYPALALTRDSGWVDGDFPGNSFNHCIAVVPTLHDTLWLECTSDVSAFDNPPASIEGVNVLLIKPAGGELVRTPLSRAEDNKAIFQAKAKLSGDRSLSVAGNIIFTGNQAIWMRARLRDKEETEKEEWLLSRFAHKAGEAQCNAFDVSGLENPDTTLVVNFDVSLKFFARKAGSRFILDPALFHKVYFEGEDPEERTMPLMNLTRYLDQEMVSFEIPRTFYLRSATKGDTVRSAFGIYANNLQPDGDKLVWSSSFTSRAREVSLENYHDYYLFMNAVKKKAAKKIVLNRS